MEADEGMEEDGPYRAWLPPDDRLWRHPSEGPDPRGASSAEGDGSGGSGGSRSLRSRLAGWAHIPPARIWAIAVVSAIIGAVAATGVGMLTGAFEQQTMVVHSVAPTAPTVTLSSETASGVDWSGVDDAIAPSVVGVQVTTTSGPATGSGLIFELGNPDTYVVTNSSLVAGASGISVSLVGGEQYRAKVVGSDPLSGLAVLAVGIPSGYQALPQLGSVADVRLADPVLAVGARAGASASVFSGSVTGEDQEVDVTGGSTMENLIAVGGSSPLPSTAAGGPLVNQFGQVLGITVSLDPTNSSDESLLFAVPVDEAEHIGQQLLAGTRVTHPWLGVVDTYDVTSNIANQYGVTGAAEVIQVSPGSPAARMGLHPNDIITSMAGQPVTSSGSLTSILFSQGVPGRPLVVRYLHAGKWDQKDIYVTDQVSQPSGE